MSDISIISGRSNEPLARAIAARLNLSFSPVIFGRYSSGESKIELPHSVRNQTVFIVQSGNTFEKDGPSPNDYIMETIMLADACFNSSARDIFLLMPCIPYCDEKEENCFGEPIDIETIECENDLQRWMKKSLFHVTPEALDDPDIYKKLKEHHESVPKSFLRPIAPMALASPLKLVAKLLTCTGISKLLTFAIPRHQLVGFFDIPVDDLQVAPILFSFRKKRIEEYTIASSDLGLAKNASQIAKSLNCPFALLHKLPGQEEFSFSGESVESKNILLIDEIGKRAYEAASTFKKRSCSNISLLVTHFLLDSPTKDIPEFLENSNLFTEIFITNSIRVPDEISKLANVHIIDLADYFAEAVKCIKNGDSLKEMQTNLMK